MGLTKNYHHAHLSSYMSRPILPEECEPKPDPKNNPPEVVRDALGQDAKKWHMWGRVCDTLAAEGRVTAINLVYDGWIGERQAITFLRDLRVYGVLQPDGIIGRGTPSGIVEYTAYRWTR